MTPELERKLRAAYPTGEIHSLVREELMSMENDDRLPRALRSITAQASLVCTADPTGDPAYKFALTQSDQPKFDDWIWGMRNPAKLRWIRQAGEPYTVLWLRVSRVADLYEHYFNFWRPRGDTGFLDIDFPREPRTPLWSSHLRLIHDTLAQFGFEEVSDELARSEVPFITEPDYDSIPEDDPRWDDDSFTPPHRPASFMQCAFGI